MSEETIKRVSAVQRAGRSFINGDGFLGRLFAAGPQKIVALLSDLLQVGLLEATLPDGQTIRLGGHHPGPSVRLTLHNWRPVRRLVTGGTTAWSRSYIDGDWDSPHLAELAELFTLNRAQIGAATRAKWWVRMLNSLMHNLRANTKKGSQENISFHYDLGNDFYKEWLDPSMTYSSALFAPGDNSLEAAQNRKYRRLLDLIDAKPGERVLEIGCGWGGFAEIAARERGLYVHGITLSKEQLDYARARIAKAGLADQVTFELRDYRDIQGSYDHVASIEMFEAVGERYWRTFMDKVASVLKPGGRAALQVITIDEALFEEYRSEPDFIQSYIFPGGMLPSVERLEAVSKAANLVWARCDAFGQHYADTLRQWLERFEEAFAQGAFVPSFDEHFKRIWRYYLTYCEGGFRGKAIDVQQVLLGKPA
jgi:cyclopropane-fatty-acyl-phospholipid synthase